MIDTEWIAVASAAGLFFYGMLAAVCMKKPVKAALTRLKVLPRMTQAILAVMTSVTTVEAQKPNNAQRGVRPRRPAAAAPAAPAQAVTAEEIAQGCRLVSVTNMPGGSFEMPTNAVLIGNIHLHGARSDFGSHVVDLDAIDGGPAGWTFPCGPGGLETSVFWWFMDGRLQDAPRNPSFTAGAALGDTLAMQGESRLWALADGDTRVVTWERFFAGGDTNAPVNAQIVLHESGDFTVRSNDVLSVYRRVYPNDWDGDGLDNTIDAAPTVYDGDCSGTGPAWLNANCGAVLSASLDDDNSLRIDWSTNANENAYYRLSFTALHDRTRVTIVCDGPSNLGDLVVIADEGQACEVPLLIGPCYRVTANRPVGNISASDPEAEIRLDEPVRLLRGAAPAAGCGPSAGFEVERRVELGFDGDGGSGRITSDPDIGVAIGSITGNAMRVRPHWWGREWWSVQDYAIICGMRQPRNFATDRCCHLAARTANGIRHTYEYDGRGQLLAVKSADGTDAERYAYDKAGNMVRKTVGGRTTTFTFDRANQLVSSARRGLSPSALWKHGQTLLFGENVAKNNN